MFGSIKEAFRLKKIKKLSLKSSEKLLLRYFLDHFRSKLTTSGHMGLLPVSDSVSYVYAVNMQLILTLVQVTYAT